MKFCSLHLGRSVVAESSAAAWSGAIATFLAVLVALGIAVAGTRRDNRLRREQAERRARLEANFVEVALAQPRTIHARLEWEVVVTNRGTFAIRNVDVELRHPTGEPVRPSSLPFASLAGGGKSERFKFVSASSPPTQPVNPTLCVVFTDDEGIRWRKHENGLVEVEEKP